MLNCPADASLRPLLKPPGASKKLLGKGKVYCYLFASGKSSYSSRSWFWLPLLKEFIYKKKKKDLRKSTPLCYPPLSAQLITLQKDSAPIQPWCPW